MSCRQRIRCSSPSTTIHNNETLVTQNKCNYAMEEGTQKAVGNVQTILSGNSADAATPSESVAIKVTIPDEDMLHSAVQIIDEEIQCIHDYYQIFQYGSQGTTNANLIDVDIIGLMKNLEDLKKRVSIKRTYTKFDKNLLNNQTYLCIKELLEHKKSFNSIISKMKATFAADNDNVRESVAKLANVYCNTTDNLKQFNDKDSKSTEVQFSDGEDVTQSSHDANQEVNITKTDYHQVEADASVLGFCLVSVENCRSSDGEKLTPKYCQVNNSTEYIQSVLHNEDLQTANNNYVTAYTDEHLCKISHSSEESRSVEEDLVSSQVIYKANMVARNNLQRIEKVEVQRKYLQLCINNLHSTVLSEFINLSTEDNFTQTASQIIDTASELKSYTNVPELIQNVTKYKEKLHDLQQLVLLLDLKMQSGEVYEQHSANIEQTIENYATLKNSLEKSIINFIFSVARKAKHYCDENKKACLVTRFEMFRESVKSSINQAQCTLSMGNSVYTDDKDSQHMKDKLTENSRILQALQEWAVQTQSTETCKSCFTLEGNNVINRLVGNENYFRKITDEVNFLSNLTQNKIVDDIIALRNHILYKGKTILLNHIQSFKQIVVVEMDKVRKTEKAIEELFTDPLESQKFRPTTESVIIMFQLKNFVKAAKDELVRLHKQLHAINVEELDIEEVEEHCMNLNSNLIEFLKFMSKTDASLECCRCCQSKVEHLIGSYDSSKRKCLNESLVSETESFEQIKETNEALLVIEKLEKLMLEILETSFKTKGIVEEQKASYKKEFLEIIDNLCCKINLWYSIVSSSLAQGAHNFKTNLYENEKMFLTVQSNNLQKNITEVVECLNHKCTLLEQLENEIILDDDVRSKLISLQVENIVGKISLKGAVQQSILTLRQCHTQLTKVVRAPNLDITSLKQNIGISFTNLNEAGELDTIIGSVIHETLKEQLINANMCISEKENTIVKLTNDLDSLSNILDPFYKEIENDTNKSGTLAILWNYLLSKSDDSLEEKLKKVVHYSDNIRKKLVHLENQLEQKNSVIHTLEKLKAETKRNFDEKDIKHVKEREELDRKLLLSENLLKEALNDIEAKNKLAVENDGIIARYITHLSKRDNDILLKQIEHEQLRQEMEKNRTEFEYKSAIMKENLIKNKDDMRATIRANGDLRETLSQEVLQRRSLQIVTKDLCSCINIDHQSLSRRLTTLSSEIESYCELLSLEDVTRGMESIHMEKSLACIENIETQVRKFEKEIHGFKGKPTDIQYLHIKEMLLQSLINLDNINSRRKEKILAERRRVIMYITGLQNVLDEKL